MADSSIWWVLTGLAVAVELMTGTFYLLMFAVGLAAAAIAAHLGMGLTAQLVIAAVIGGGAVIAWHLLRGKKMVGKNAEFNSDVNMDIGQTVQVDACKPMAQPTSNTVVHLGQCSCKKAAHLVQVATVLSKSSVVV